MGICESKSKETKEKTRGSKKHITLLLKKRKKLRRGSFFTYDQHLKRLESDISLINSKTKININEIYSISSKVIGEGEYGKVQICSLKANGKKFAVKIIKKKEVTDEKKLEQELKILRDSDHPNIVNFCETFSDDDAYYIIMELCKGGSLKDYLQKKKKIEESEAKKIIFQMCRALFYLHEIGIAHRDVKLENFVFADENCTRIKLIDFGLAKGYKISKLVTYLGTPYYVCPEILQSKPYNEKCDTWSLGVCCFKLLIGEYPFKGNDFKQLFSHIILKDIPKKKINFLSKEGQNFLKGLLEKDPKRRFKMSKCIHHNWFKDYYLEELEHAKKVIDLEFLENFKDIIGMNKFVIHMLRILFLFSEELNNIKDLETIYLDADFFLNGLLNKESIAHFFKEFNFVMSDKEIIDILHSLSIFDKDYVSFSEFVIATIGKENLMKKGDNMYRFLFKFFDTRNKNIVYITDFQEVYSRFGYEVDSDYFTGLIDLKDKDIFHNGINYETFKDFMETNLSKTSSSF